MALPVARTPAEALLYLDLLPCETCDALETPWRMAAQLSVGGEAAERYAGECGRCGTNREAVLAVGTPRRVPDATRFGSGEPSELIDAAQWLDVATDAEAGADDDADAAATPGEAVRVRRAGLEYARDAVLEAMRFLPPGADRVPAGALFSDRGRQVLAEEPLWLTRDWMDSLLANYQELLAELAETGTTG